MAVRRYTEDELVWRNTSVNPGLNTDLRRTLVVLGRARRVERRIGTCSLSPRPIDVVIHDGDVIEHFTEGGEVRARVAVLVDPWQERRCGCQEELGALLRRAELLKESEEVRGVVGRDGVTLCRCK